MRQLTGFCLIYSSDLFTILVKSARDFRYLSGVDLSPFKLEKHIFTASCQIRKNNYYIVFLLKWIGS